MQWRCVCTRSAYGGTYMLTKVLAFGITAVFIGCGSRTASIDEQKPSAALPAGFDSGKATSVSTIPAGALVQVRMAQSVDTQRDRKSTRLNSSHANISYAVFCLKK